MSALLGQALLTDGLNATWDTIICPVLSAAGAFWARTGQGVEVEHLLARAVSEALTAYRQCLPSPETDWPPIVLACVPRDEHTLPLEALATALFEAGRPARMLGGVPSDALAATVRRTGARAALVWAQVTDSRTASVPKLPASRPRLRLVAAGPGWTGAQLPVGVAHVNDLGSAMKALLLPARA